MGNYQCSRGLHMSGRLIRRVGTPIFSNVRFTGHIYSNFGAPNIFKRCNNILSKKCLSSAPSSKPTFLSQKSPGKALFSPTILPLGGWSARQRSPAGSSRPRPASTCGQSSGAMDLGDVVTELNRLAPLSLAESWDNVGLLVQPTPPHTVRTLLLTNDLTEAVLDEAVAKRADMILSYHPPIFRPLKRLTMGSAKERIIVRAIENRMAVYSPHTCYDALKDGVNDWLATTLVPGKSSISCEPLKTSYKKSETGWTHRVEYMETAEGALSLPNDMGTSASAVTRTQTNDGFQCTLSCNEKGLIAVMTAIREAPAIRKTLQITKLEEVPIISTGVGRLVTFDTAPTLSNIVESIKSNLGLQHVQLAIGAGKALDSVVKTAGICAGSGASVLANVPADLYYTGEMSHHEILAAVAAGTSVVLCNHSNTERGYLHVLKDRLKGLLHATIDVVVSEVDADPLRVV